MDPSGWIVALTVVVLVGWVLAQPLLRPMRRGSAVPADVSSLQAQVDQVIETMRELDFDYALGKISEEDYSPHRAALLAHGAELLKELDRQRGLAARPRSQQEESLEREIAARRKAPASPRLESDRLEDEIRARRRAPRAQKKEAGSRRAGLCPRCGQAIQVGDRFCPHCGVALNHGI